MLSEEAASLLELAILSPQVAEALSTLLETETPFHEKNHQEDEDERVVDSPSLSLSSSSLAAERLQELKRCLKGVREERDQDSSTSNDWVRVDRLENPHCRSIGDREVQEVLNGWVDVDKREILEGWVSHIAEGGDITCTSTGQDGETTRSNEFKFKFRPAVQVSGLPGDVKEGFLSTILPLLLRRKGARVEVHVRDRVEHRVVHDLRVRVSSCVQQAEAEARGVSGAAAIGMKTATGGGVFEAERPERADGLDFLQVREKLRGWSFPARDVRHEARGSREARDNV